MRPRGRDLAAIWRDQRRQLTVAVRGEEQLGADEQYLAVESEHPGIEPVAPVHDGHANVKKNIAA